MQKYTIDMLGKIILVAITVSLLLFVMFSINDSVKEQNTRARTMCPSLLSITRSARDTLIVMKVEPMCNRYVLDNLK